MKVVLALVLVTVGAVLVHSTPTGDTTSHQSTQYTITDKDFLERQRKVLLLFKHVNQPSLLDEHAEIVKTFSIEERRDHFTKPEAVDKIVEFYEAGYQLPKGEIFSISYPDHLEQAAAVFDLLYNAKDFDTFYKTAVVARHWINEGLFLYSYSVAVVHRADCYGIVLPPIYEIHPHYFFNGDVIQRAYRYKQTWDEHAAPQAAAPGKYHTIVANYSGHYLNLHPEQSLSYYLEDVGINAYYYYYFLYYPFWMDGETYGLQKDRRGDLYFFVNQQLLARFYLERLSNGFGQIQTVDFSAPIETPFYPSLQYPGGLPFPERPKFARVSDYFYSYGQHIGSPYAYSYTYYQDYSRRIADAIDRGFAYNAHGKRVELYDEKSGFNDLGNLLQGNPDSPDSRYYGPWLGYGRHLMGYSFTPLDTYKVAPSALEHVETSLRDPGFYQLYKRLHLFYYRYQSRLEPYTRQQLAFPGVSIEKVEMDRLITYFDEFYADLSQGVFYSEDELKKGENGFFVRAKQHRLNHKPFTYKIHVKSDKDAKAVVKVFIGPKYDEYGRYINISENRWNFFQLDKFVYDLKNGDNTIKRSSFESKYFGPDKTSYYDLYRRVTGAIRGETDFTVDARENYFCFPHRYMLPQGTYGGYPYQFYFIVYPYKQYQGNQPQEWTYSYPRPGVGGPFIEDYPTFYPFDRPIKYGRVFYEEIPNAFFYETKIFHRRDVNAVTHDE